MTDLYLIDIDGTLLDSSSFHEEVVKRGFKEIFDMEAEPEVLKRNSGKPYLKYFEDTFMDLGARPDKVMKYADKMIEYWEKGIKIKLDQKAPDVLPGVYDFLSALEKRGHVTGIITGNPQIVGRTLLKKTGLIKHFRLEAYSDNLKDRKDLIMRGVKLAEKSGIVFNDVVVVGDGASDVDAAKRAGFFGVGVETGHYSADELYEAGADLVLKTLESYELIFDRIRK